MAEDHSDDAAAFVYTRESEGVRVEVEPAFLPGESYPHRSGYVWRYQIRIANLRDEPVRLLRRYWRLTDSAGVADEVRGDGVVGQQPLIKPGEAFEYASFAPLRTPSGVMGGHFEMKTAAGVTICVETPLFSLDSPLDKPSLN